VRPIIDLSIRLLHFFLSFYFFSLKCRSLRCSSRQDRPRGFGWVEWSGVLFWCSHAVVRGPV